MDEKELREPANWVLEDGVSRPAVQPSRAVVSVRFSGDDLAIVARAAREQGMKTSEFIRNAALEKASKKSHRSFDASVAGASEGVSTTLTSNWRKGTHTRLVIRSSQGKSQMSGSSD